MRHRLLERLCCPIDQGTLHLEAFLESDEIEEGKLTCVGCHREFPVINGIPRLLPDELAHLVVSMHGPFFRRHADAMVSFVQRSEDSSVSKKDQHWWAAEHQTLKSYSYQWRTFKEMRPHWEQLFLDSIHPITAGFFKGKIGLDAGCGFGRSLYYAAHYGAEIIGLDLSEAVEAARENARQLPNVHLIQGDIFHPPLKDHSLDFVYSIGVLQHLPSPRGGFLRLAQLLKPQSPIFVWVYARGRGRQIVFLDALRSLTMRMPQKLLNGLCGFFAALHWILWIAPYKLLCRIRVTRKLAEKIPFTYHARFPFGVLHTDWFDGLAVPLQAYHRREEVIEWLEEANLERTVIDPAWGIAGGGRALGYAPQIANSIQHTAHRTQEAKSV